MTPGISDYEYIAQVFVEAYEESVWLDEPEDFLTDWHLRELHKNIKTLAYVKGLPTQVLQSMLFQHASKFLSGAHHECQDEDEFTRLVEHTCEYIASEKIVESMIAKFASREIDQLEKFFGLD